MISPTDQGELSTLAAVLRHLEDALSQLPTASPESWSSEAQREYASMLRTLRWDLINLKDHIAPGMHHD